MTAVKKEKYAEFLLILPHPSHPLFITADEKKKEKKKTMPRSSYSGDFFLIEVAISLVPAASNIRLHAVPKVPEANKTKTMSAWNKINRISFLQNSGKSSLHTCITK